MMDELSEEMYDGIDGNDCIDDFIQADTMAAIDELRELLTIVSPLPHKGLEWTIDAVVLLAVMEMIKNVETKLAEKSMVN